MTITFKLNSDTEVRVKNIRELSHTKDNMLILVPNCGVAQIEVNGEVILNSELPSFDARMIHAIDIKL